MYSVEYLFFFGIDILIFHEKSRVISRTITACCEAALLNLLRKFNLKNRNKLSLG